MKRIVLVLALALSSWTAYAVAEDYTAGTIEIDNPWARATPKGATVAGAYMTIKNKGTAPDRLVGGSVAVANKFQVHQMLMEKGIAKMRPVEGGLEIKPGESVQLKPGSYHVMLMGLKQPLEKGQKIKGTLQFEKAGKVDIEYTVEAAGAGTPGAMSPGMPGMGGQQH